MRWLLARGQPVHDVEGKVLVARVAVASRVRPVSGVALCGKHGRFAQYARPAFAERTGNSLRSSPGRSRIVERHAHPRIITVLDDLGPGAQIVSSSGKVQEGEAA